jgi:hypothetical protein
VLDCDANTSNALKLFDLGVVPIRFKRKAGIPSIYFIARQIVNDVKSAESHRGKLFKT